MPMLSVGYRELKNSETLVDSLLRTVQRISCFIFLWSSPFFVNKEEFKREGTYVYLWLIHAAVWQKPTQYCKAMILQLKLNKFKKTKQLYP